MYSKNEGKDKHVESIWFPRLDGSSTLPKKNIHTYYSYYDKRTGLNTDFNSLLSKFTSAKAQIIIAERKEKEYIEYQRANNLFFDERTDEQLLWFHEKLRTKKEKYTALEQQIRSGIEAMSKNQ